MAKLYVSEFASAKRVEGHGNTDYLDMQQWKADQAVTFSTATQSAAFNEATHLIRVAADGICSIKVGADPTATTNNLRLIAGQEIILGVRPGWKISAVTNT